MIYINNKYILLEKIGIGSFGTIYKGENIRTKEKVAIKIEPIHNETKLLKNESKIYNYLSGNKGIPTVKWFGKDDENYYINMDNSNAFIFVVDEEEYSNNNEDEDDSDTMLEPNENTIFRADAEDELDEEENDNDELDSVS